MQLPDHPNLRHLRDQAKDLVRTGAIPNLAAAQLQLARGYGFPSWPKLKRHVESLEQAGELRQSLNRNDLAGVDALLTANPELRQVLIDDVPLQRVAQPGRIPMMELLVRHGADVNGLCWGGSPLSSRLARISNRNRCSGFSITAPTLTAATRTIPAPPSTTSSGLTRATPSA